MKVRNVCNPRYYEMSRFYIDNIIISLQEKDIYVCRKLLFFVSFLSVGYTNHLQTTLRGKVE